MLRSAPEALPAAHHFLLALELIRGKINAFTRQARERRLQSMGKNAGAKIGKLAARDFEQPEIGARRVGVDPRARQFEKILAAPGDSLFDLLPGPGEGDRVAEKRRQSARQPDHAAEAVLNLYKGFPHLFASREKSNAAATPTSFGAGAAGS